MGGLSLPILVYLMAGEVSTPALVLWTAAMLISLVLRFRLIGIYRLRYDSVDGPQRQAFIERYGWSWPAIGLLWGGPVALSYLQASFITQFICALLVVGQGLVTLAAYSAYRPIYRSYTNALSLSALIGLVLATVLYFDRTDPLQTTALFAVLVVFWALLQMAGVRLHQVYRSSFELQFSNQEQIDSLTLGQRSR